MHFHNYIFNIHTSTRQRHQDQYDKSSCKMNKREIINNASGVSKGSRSHGNPNQLELLQITKIRKIPNSLRSDAFFQAENAPQPFSAGSQSRTPLDEITMLPKLPRGPQYRPLDAGCLASASDGPTSTNTNYSICIWTSHHDDIVAQNWHYNIAAW